MKIEENNNQYKMYLALCNLFMCISVMGTFIFNEHFATDNYYALFNLNKDLGWMDISSNLRVVMGCIQIIFSILGINYVEEQMLFGSLLIVAFAWVITKVSMEIIEILDAQHEINKIILINNSTLILFLNAFLSEFLYFVGYIQWTIGVFGAVYSALFIGKERRTLKNWFLGVFFLSISLGTYQIFTALYVYIVMTIIFLRNKGEITVRSVLSVFKAIAATIIAFLINMICRKILLSTSSIENSGRMSLKLSSIPALIAQIFQDQRQIWMDGMGIYPRYMLGLCLILLLGTLFVMIYKRKVENKTVINLFVVLISGQCVVYMAQIAQGFVWFAPRTIYPVIGIFSVAIWIIAFYMDGVKEKLLMRIIMVLSVAILIVSNIKVNVIAVDTAKTNTVTKCYADEINKRICHYEIENGIEITKIGFCYDAYISYRYSGFISESSYSGNICENPFIRLWSDITSLNYYTGRDFVRVEVPEEIAAYYRNQNWDDANWNEQLTFDNDTVYICVF